MRVELSHSLILHRRSWRETSLLVEAFSRAHGRLGLIAKGAQRPRGRWRGLLEPLVECELSWTGRGELPTLTGADPVRSHSLSGNALMAGLYASELIMRLTARDDPHPALYDSAIALLEALAGPAPAIVVLRFFERDLLDAIGYGITLDAVGARRPVVADGCYLYHPERGIEPATRAPAAGEMVVAGRTLLGLAHGRFAANDDVRQARALMQAALAPHLGDRPLQSVRTLKAMQQFAANKTSSEPGA